MKDVYESELEELADAEWRRHPDESREQSFAKILFTPAAQELHRLSRTSEARLPLPEAIAKRRTRVWLDRRGFTDWGDLVARAALKLNPKDPAVGLTMVERRYPEMFRRYIEERQGR